jgi:hypothetical protein
LEFILNEVLTKYLLDFLPVITSLQDPSVANFTLLPIKVPSDDGMSTVYKGFLITMDEAGECLTNYEVQVFRDNASGALTMPNAGSYVDCLDPASLMSSMGGMGMDMGGGEEMPPPMAGGYSPIENLQDINVISAANFAVDELKAGRTTKTMEEYPFLKVLGNPKVKSVKSLVVDGTQQVVAGINYNLTVAILNKNDKCFGAFMVLLNDFMSNKTVLEWGPSRRCRQLIPN